MIKKLSPRFAKMLEDLYTLEDVCRYMYNISSPFQVEQRFTMAIRGPTKHSASSAGLSAPQRDTKRPFIVLKKSIMLSASRNITITQMPLWRRVMLPHM